MEKRSDEMPQEKRKSSKTISNKELLRLKEEGLTYQQITDYFNSQGIKVSLATIRRRIMEICEIKQIEMKKRKKGQRAILNDELLRLKEEGLTYQEITNYFNSQGIKVSLATIRRRIMEICETKQIEIPKSEKDSRIPKKEIPEEILEELEQSGCSYREMEKHLKEKGIDATYETIRKRIVQKEAERKDIQSKKLHKELIECLIKLRESKKATDEQLEIIARQYGVSLNGTRMPKILLSEDELELD